LITFKHLVATANVTLPLPTKHDPTHHIEFILTSQNDLKKNLGVSNIRIVDHFKISNWIELKNSFKLLHEGWN
jgi:hypothetical protein